MPTIDMTIDRMKATLARVIFTRPMVTFEARGDDSFRYARDAEVFFNWLISEHMRDFKEQIILGLDSILQYGFTVFKVYWEYESRNVTRTLNRSDLPRSFRDVFPVVGEEEANAEFFRAGKIIVPVETLRQAIDDKRDEFEASISKALKLDPEEELDSKALKDIVEFFRKGKESVTYQTKQILQNAPRCVTLDPQDFIVPRDTCDLQDATRITQRLLLPRTRFRQIAKDHGWSEKAVEKILEQKREDQGRSGGIYSRSLIDPAKDFREGVHTQDTDDLIEVWEVYFHLDIDNDNVDERCWMVVQPDSQTLLKDPREIPFEDGEWPFVKINLELNDPRFYSSRGIPEKTDDIDLIITERERNKLNALDLMVPTWKYRLGSEINPGAFHFIPGEMYPVLAMDDIQPFEVPDRVIHDDREINSLLLWLERLIGGSPEMALSQGNISEARTAREIDAVRQSSLEVLSFRGLVIQLGMRKVYGKIWDLWNQWGPEEVYVRVTGQEYRRITKEDILGDFNITPMGTVETTDPAIEVQRSLARLQLLFQLRQLFPDGLPEWEIDYGEAIARHYQRDNILDAMAIIRRRSPEEAAAFAQRQAQLNELVERAQTNQPQTIPEAQAAIREIEKRAPFGSRQRLRPRNGR